MSETVSEELHSEPRRTETVVRIALFALTLAVYLKTLCPTIFADDCGEIATAVATGGVMHPPGYPLYTLVGGWFVHLIPFGEAAWRLGLLSALAASGAVVLAYGLARRAGASVTWAVTSAAAFAFSIALWEQATKVETYALNAFFVALILNRSAEYHKTGSRRDLIFAALSCGFGLTNHLTIACALTGALWLVLGGLSRDKRPALAFLAALAAFAAPLSLYALIWVAAVSHPGGQVWGDPSNWRRFVLHVTGARYRVYLGNITPLGLARRDFLGVPALLWQNLSWILVGVIPGVARGLFQAQTRRLHQAMLITAAAYLLETSAYGIMNIFEYYTPLLLLLSIWAGIGFEAIVNGVGKRFGAPKRTVRLAASGLCALAALGSLMTHWSACDRSRATFIRNFALNMLRTTPPRAVLIASGDNVIFPLWYAQGVLGVRRDVTVIPRTLVTSLGTPSGRDEAFWFVKMLAHEHSDLVDAKGILAKSIHDPKYSAAEGPMWDIVDQGFAKGLPVYTAAIDLSEVTIQSNGTVLLKGSKPQLAIQTCALADRILPLAELPSIQSQAKEAVAAEKSIEIDNAPAPLMADEPDGNVTNTLYAQMLSRDALLLEQAGNIEGGYQRRDMAVALDPNASNLAALAEACERTRRVSEGVEAMHDAVNLDPLNAKYRAGLREMQQITASNPQAASKV